MASTEQVDVDMFPLWRPKTEVGSPQAEQDNKTQ